MLTKCRALEWGARGIRVNGVSPGPIADTEGLARLTGEGDLADRVQAALALPYFGRGSDVGEAVAFLCSDAASYVTGTILDCDGGMRLGDLPVPSRSEEHTSELQSLMRISYAVFCLKKKNNTTHIHKTATHI